MEGKAGLVGLCFNCGSRKHTREQCPQPQEGDGARFAVCYICKEQGHLSSKCPQSSHGLYPDGGGCRVCGEVDHYARDCPEKARKLQRTRVQTLADEDPDTLEPQISPLSIGLSKKEAFGKPEEEEEAAQQTKPVQAKKSTLTKQTKTVKF